MEKNKIEQARQLIKSLAEGKNPIDGSELEEQNIINNVKISRQLFFVYELLSSNDIKNKKYNMSSIIPFHITSEINHYLNNAKPEHLTEFLKIVNLLIVDDMEKIKRTKIVPWLISEGYLNKERIDNKNVCIVTEKGQAMGLLNETRNSSYGRPYTIVLYSVEAQKTVLQNYNIIKEYVNNSVEENIEERHVNESDIDF